MARYDSVYEVNLAILDKIDNIHIDSEILEHIDQNVVTCTSVLNSIGGLVIEESEILRMINGNVQDNQQALNSIDQNISVTNQTLQETQQSIEDAKQTLISIDENVDQIKDEIKDSKTVIGDEWMEKILTDYNILKDKYERLLSEKHDADHTISEQDKHIKDLQNEILLIKQKFKSDIEALNKKLADEIADKRSKIKEIARLKARVAELERIISEQGREKLLKEITKLKEENAYYDNLIYDLKKQLKNAQAIGYQRAMSFCNGRNYC